MSSPKRHVFIAILFLLKCFSLPRRYSWIRWPSLLPVSPTYIFLQRVQVMQWMALAEIQVERSVILMDRLGPDISSVLILDVSSIFSIFSRYSRYFLNILDVFSIFSIFAQYSRYFLNILDIFSIFSIFPRYSRYFLNILDIFSIFSIFSH